MGIYVNSLTNLGQRRRNKKKMETNWCEENYFGQSWIKNSIPCCVDGRWARGRKHQRAPHEKERRPVSLDLFLVPPLDDGWAAGSPLQLSIWVERLNLVYVCAVLLGRTHAHWFLCTVLARLLAGRGDWCALMMTWNY